MAISLTPEDKKLIQKRMKTGLFKSVEEVIHDALAAQDSEAEWLIDNKASRPGAEPARVFHTGISMVERSADQTSHRRALATLWSTGGRRAAHRPK